MFQWSCTHFSNLVSLWICGSELVFNREEINQYHFPFIMNLRQNLCICLECGWLLIFFNIIIVYHLFPNLSTGGSAWRPGFGVGTCAMLDLLIRFTGVCVFVCHEFSSLINQFLPFQNVHAPVFALHMIPDGRSKLGSPRSFFPSNSLSRYLFALVQCEACVC